MLDWQKILRNTGVHEYGIVNAKDVEFSDEVRGYCEINTCRQYQKTWACPPACGTVAECRERAQGFKRMLVFTGKFELEDSLDFKGMIVGLKGFKKIAAAVDKAAKSHLNNYMVLSNEGCGKCDSCTYPNAPCRFPEKLHHSIEGYGIFVSKLAVQAGVKYNNGEKTVTYFGAVLFSEEEGKAARAASSVSSAATPATVATLAPAVAGIPASRRWRFSTR